MASTMKKASKSKFVGMVAPPLVAKRESLDLELRVKPEQLAALTGTAKDVIAAAESVTDTAAKVVQMFASQQPLQNQRVQIVVLDAAGAQVASAVHELKKDETLKATIADGFIEITSLRERAAE